MTDWETICQIARRRVLVLAVAAERGELNGQRDDGVVLEELSSELHKVAEAMEHVTRGEWSQAEQEYDRTEVNV